MQLSVVQGTTVQEFQAALAGSYYDGDAYPVGRGAGDEGFRFESIEAGAIRVMRYSGLGVGVRRAWRHIREGNSTVYVLWLPVEGQVKFSQDSMHDIIAGPRSAAITFGDRPFNIRAITEPGETFCQINVLIPAHIIRTYLPSVDHFCGRSFTEGAAAIEIAASLFSTMLSSAENLTDSAAELLTRAAVETLCEALKLEAGDFDPQLNQRQSQLRTVEKFLDRHMSAQNLCASNVAEGCGISLRYLHYLMKMTGKTFSQYLWDMRLQRANEWLADPLFRHFKIVDIAYMAGFKNASHFSHLYNRTFEMSPKQARADQPDAKTTVRERELA